MALPGFEEMFSAWMDELADPDSPQWPLLLHGDRYRPGILAVWDRHPQPCRITCDPCRQLGNTIKGHGDATGVGD